MDRINQYRANEYLRRIRQAIRFIDKYIEYIETSMDASVLNSEVMYMLNSIKANLKEPSRAEFYKKGE